MDVDSSLNLALIFGLGLIGGSAVYAIRAWSSKHLPLQGAIMTVAALIMGFGLVFSQIG